MQNYQRRVLCGLIAKFEQRNQAKGQLLANKKVLVHQDSAAVRHVPYLPDLVSSDYFLFENFKIFQQLRIIAFF